MKKYSKFLKIVFLASLVFVACKSKIDPKQAEMLKLGIHTIVIEDVIQTSQYTYLLFKETGNPDVNENDTVWCAVSAMEAKKGDKFYYKGGFPMENFPSKELNRTFAKILFIDDLSKNPDFVKKEIAAIPSHNSMSSTDTSLARKPKIEKLDIKIDAVSGGISIGDLFSKKDTYSGKTVKVKGQVIKFSPEIMGKNWIHLQDGTASKDGKFDLTLTTDQTVKVGDIVIFEGKIALNKDLGYDYFYEVLMEDAKVLK
jgi:hypothetical protein